MFHALFQPLLRLVSTRPEVLGDHAQAYVELFASELDSASARVKRQVLLASLGICGLGAGAVLAGVALMLWAALPSLAAPALWVLILVPLSPFVMAIACLVSAKRQGQAKAFGHLREQAEIDLAMFRQASAP